MGSYTVIEENRNCIKSKYKNPNPKEFEQYDSLGNNVYNYIKDPESLKVENFNVYDINQRKIGSIEKQTNSNKVEYTLYNQNNQRISHIERIDDCCTCCCSINYNFYGLENNIEASIIVKSSNCCSTVYEVYDKYNTMINRAEIVSKCCDIIYLNEYDQNSNQVFKIILNRVPFSREFKIFDNNENEINLADKTLFNNGFSKIQIILILELIFFQSNTDY